MNVIYPRSKPRYPDVPCSRLVNKTRCNEKSEFMFGDKNMRGKNIIYGMCEKHSAENGVRHASPEKELHKLREVEKN